MAEFFIFICLNKIYQVFLRGNLVMKGYFKEEKATKKAFANGWFASGDLAVWHADGYIQVL